MDAEKTGALIARARHELNLTQKELAARLHVSDRAVSKWERGAGFPDVSLLEPLADELGLSVAELLKGEQGLQTGNGNEAIRDAIRLARQQVWRAIRRNAASVLIVVLFLVFFAEATGFWERILVREKAIDCIVTAGVYTAQGDRTGETQVEILGEWMERWGEPGGWYYGRFAIEGVRETCFDDVRVMISRRKDDDGNLMAQEIMRYRGGVMDFETFRGGCYFEPTAQHFAVMMMDGTIIATHEHLAELMTLYPNIYHLDNPGLSVFH